MKSTKAARSSWFKKGFRVITKRRQQKEKITRPDMVFLCLAYIRIPPELVNIITTMAFHSFTNESLATAVNKWTQDPETTRQQFGPIATWDTSRVTDMSGLFSATETFNENITYWNTSKVQKMDCMFFNALAFNQPLAWDTRSVTSMACMFMSAVSFNQPLDHWDTRSVTSMSYMFSVASSFNQKISWKKTPSLTDTSSMFLNARSFNQVVVLDTRKVTNMSYMFSFASDLNKNLSFDIRSAKDLTCMFTHASALQKRVDFFHSCGDTVIYRIDADTPVVVKFHK